MNIKASVVDDLETICEAVGTKKAKLVNAIIEHYLYDDDVIIQNGKTQINVQDILKTK